jgi:TctA family transporter
MISPVIRAVIWPIMLVVFVVVIGSIASLYWAPALLVSAAWLGWIAFQGARNAAFVWRAILRGRPWRDEYYESLYRQGASRREAFRGSGVAPVRDPLLAVLAGFMAVSLAYSFFCPSASKRSSQPDDSTVESATANPAKVAPRRPR